MVRLRSWSGSPRQTRHQLQRRVADAGYDNAALADADDDAQRRTPNPGGRLVGGTVENCHGRRYGTDSESSSSSESESVEEGTYELNAGAKDTAQTASSAASAVQVEGEADTPDDDTSDDVRQRPFVAGVPFRDACQTLSAHLTDAGEGDEDKLTWALKYLQHEWLKTAARRNANAAHVDAVLDLFETYSRQLLDRIVNICDQNENTALHYAVSHGNFDVVSVLLDSKVCRLTRPNKAGYTPVMLAALCPVADETQRTVLQRLFHMGDVNVKASQHGQTALMLAVSHGKTDTVRLLLDCGAGLNIQDEDGSTALMCAAEHGHRDIVRLLLAQTDIDASIADYDGSTALSIAVENGHRDIGVLIYAHLNYGRGGSASSPARSPAAASTGAHKQRTTTNQKATEPPAPASTEQTCGSSGDDSNC